MAYVKKKKLKTPESLADMLEIVGDIEVPRARQSEMQTYSDFYDGSKAALSYKHFPPPTGTKELECQYDDNRKNLLLINRVKCVVRTWSGILNGDVTREVRDCPNREIVAPYINSHDYSETTGAWKKNAILYGTQVAVPIYDADTREIDVWLPFPVRTVIVTAKTNVKKIIAVVEINDGWSQFVSLWGEGIVHADGTANVSPREYDVLPVAIGYGYSRLHERQINGMSMCKDALEFSVVETNCAFNINLLARQQTRDILAIIGDPTLISQSINNPDVSPGMSEDGNLVLPQGFTAEFLKPNPRIDQSINVGKYYQSLFSSISGIPIDIIAPDQVSNPSNESARIRSTSLISEAKDIVPRWLSTEMQLMYALIYVVDYHESEESPLTNFADIKSRSDVEVRNNYKILPTSPNELTQNSIALVAAGLQRKRDAIKEINPGLSPEEIEDMIDEYAEQIAAGINPHQQEQIALKTSKDALTDGQKSVLDNGN